MTTKARQDRLLALLLRDAEWSTAASLADALGVKERKAGENWFCTDTSRPSRMRFASSI